MCEIANKVLKLLLLTKFTFIGAPQIWNGDVDFILTDDDNMTYAYSRSLDNRVVLAVFDISLDPREIILDGRQEGAYYTGLPGANNDAYQCKTGRIQLNIAPFSGIVLKK